MLETNKSDSVVIVDNEHDLDFKDIQELGYDIIEINTKDN